MTDCIRCKWYDNCTIRKVSIMTDKCDGFQDIAELRSACDEAQMLYTKNDLKKQSLTQVSNSLECNKDKSE